MTKSEYLARHILHDLTNLNEGEDGPQIPHYAQNDFAVVLVRVEEKGIGVTGIEVWRDGALHDALSHKDMATKPSDSSWYWAAFEAFSREDEEFHYTASFDLPPAFLRSLPEAEPLSFHPYGGFRLLSGLLFGLGCFFTVLFYVLFQSRPQWSPFPYLVAFILFYCILSLVLFILGAQRVSICPECGEIVLKGLFKHCTIQTETVKNLLREVNSYSQWSARAHFHIRCVNYYFQQYDGRLIPLARWVREHDFMRGYEQSREAKVDRLFVRAGDELGVEVIYYDRDWRHRDRHSLRPHMLSHALLVDWGYDAKLEARLEARMQRSRRMSWIESILFSSVFAAVAAYNALSTLLAEGWSTQVLVASLIGLLFAYMTVSSYRSGGDRYTEL